MIAPNEALAGKPKTVSLAEIEAACKTLATTRARAERLMATIERERQAILDEHTDQLKELAGDLATAHEALVANLQHGRQFFIKPKTQNFHGIEVGFEKERDSLIVPNDEILIPRIETLLKSKAATLIRTFKSVVKEAIKQLTPTEKQTLGFQTVKGGDKVVVRVQSQSDVEKFFAGFASSQIEKTNRK